MQYQDQGEGNREILPDWFFFFGGKTEQMERMEEEAGQTASMSQPALKFVYAWSMVLFFALVAYGILVVVKRQSYVGLIVAMLLFAQFSLMNLLMMTHGVISSDNRDMEDSIYGWFGQTSVLMACTDFWYIAYCTVFSVVFGVRIFMERRRKMAEGDEERAEAGYQKYEAPEITVQDKKEQV